MPLIEVKLYDARVTEESVPKIIENRHGARDPGQFRPVVNRHGQGWHWLSACDIPSVILSLVHALHPLVGNIRLFGLLLRLVRAGDCRVGHDPAAHGRLAALRALDSRERLTCEEGHFGGLWLSRGSPSARRT